MKTFPAFILSIGPDSFWCRIYGDDEPKVHELEMEIEINKLEREEREYLVVGAFLNIEVDEQSSEVSLKFIRKVWTEEDLEEGRRTAREYEELFDSR